MAVGSKGPVMSTGARELKPPLPGAGAPQGSLEDGPALGEDGEDGSQGDGATGWGDGHGAGDRVGGLMPSS